MVTEVIQIITGASFRLIDNNVKFGVKFNSAVKYVFSLKIERVTGQLE